MNWYAVFITGCLLVFGIPLFFVIKDTTKKPTIIWVSVSVVFGLTWIIDFIWALKQISN